MASTPLFLKLDNFQIYIFDKCLSDKFQNCLVTENFANNFVNTNGYYQPVNTRWNTEKGREYKANFNALDITNLEARLESVEQNSLFQLEMETLAKYICNIYNYNQCKEYWYL